MPFRPDTSPTTEYDLSRFPALGLTRVRGTVLSVGQSHGETGVVAVSLGDQLQGAVHVVTQLIGSCPSVSLDDARHLLAWVMQVGVPTPTPAPPSNVGSRLWEIKDAVLEPLEVQSLRMGPALRKHVTT